MRRCCAASIIALAEMGRRGMTAVIYLTNFWEWSGGMMTYLYWTNGGRYIDMNDPAHPWPEFADMSSEFYGHAAAVRDVSRLCPRGRRHGATGSRASFTATIRRSWPGSSPTSRARAEAPKLGHEHMAAYLAWIDATARLIKSLDPNHLVSTGSEGTQGCIEDEPMRHRCPRFACRSIMSPRTSGRRTGAGPIPKDLAGTWPTTERNMRDYLAQQVGIAKRARQAAGDRGVRFPARRRELRSGHADDIQGPLLRAHLRRRSRQRPLGRAAAGLQFLGLGRRRTGAASRTIISCAATPATSATRRTSRRAGTACSTPMRRPRR